MRPSTPRPPAPDLRLGYNPVIGKGGRWTPGTSPDLRLGVPMDGGLTGNRVQMVAALGAPDVRLGVAPDSTTTLAKRFGDPMRDAPPASVPAILVSFVYLRQFLKHQDRFVYRDWALDSGAFSAHASGVTIENAAYLDEAARLLAEDPSLAEVYALDVIGDWRASAKNVDEAWARGVPAIPTYHAGEPEEVLVGLCRDFPKVALGGVARARSARKMAWARQCFARVWPARLHGFGFGARAHVLGLPWHSTDATNWELAPCRYGTWKGYDGARVSVRGSAQNLRVEVEHYLGIEREARQRWAREMEQLAALPTERRA